VTSCINTLPATR